MGYDSSRSIGHNTCASQIISENVIQYAVLPHGDTSYPCEIILGNHLAAAGVGHFVMRADEENGFGQCAVGICFTLYAQGGVLAAEVVG